MNENLHDDIALLKQRLAGQEALNRLLQARLDNRERLIDHLQAQLDKLRRMKSAAALKRWPAASRKSRQR